MDITSVQHLIDVRNQLDRYAQPDKVDWHFACISNRWTKRALVSAGFGYPTPKNDGKAPEPWKPIFSVAHIGGSDSAAAAAQSKKRVEDPETAHVEKGDVIAGATSADASSSGSDLGRTLSHSKAYRKTGGRVAAVQGINRPLFHVDLTSALQSAVANVEGRESEQAYKKGVGTEALKGDTL